MVARKRCNVGTCNSQPHCVILRDRMATAPPEVQGQITLPTPTRLADFVFCLGSLLDHHAAAADLRLAPSGLLGASANRERPNVFPWMTPRGFPQSTSPAISSKHERVPKKSHASADWTPSFMTFHAHPPPSGAGAHCAHDMTSARSALQAHLTCHVDEGKGE